MIDNISILLSILFAMIAVLHIYWAVGGKGWIQSVLPTTTDGRVVMEPGYGAFVVVILGLIGLSVLYLSKSALIADLGIPNLHHKELLFVSLVFILRAIGDFKYVGFFKKIKNTSFGSLDTKYFSPLCVVVAVLTFVLYNELIG
jgi:hypothetical protein